MSPNSFYDWEQQFKKELNVKKELSSQTRSSEPFITIQPAWKTKRNYALITIKQNVFKLFEKGHFHFKKYLKELLEFFLFVNPEGYNGDIENILNEVYKNKKKFKEYWNKRLEVY